MARRIYANARMLSQRQEQQHAIKTYLILNARQQQREWLPEIVRDYATRLIIQSVYEHNLFAVVFGALNFHSGMLLTRW